MSDMCYTASLEELQANGKHPAAILTVSVAAYRALEKRALKPDFVAATAWVNIPRSLPPVDWIFSSREICSRPRPLHAGSRARCEGAMAAILGLPPAEVFGDCKKAADHEVVSPANLNSPSKP